MIYYLLCEDLSTAVIGPFPDRDSAERHAQFCRDRGDGATMRVFDETEAPSIIDDRIGTIMTPDEDRNWVAPTD